MLIFELTISLVFALLFSIVLPWVFNIKRTLKKFLAYFLSIFFIVIASFKWIEPVGEIEWGNIFVPIIILAILGGLLVFIGVISRRHYKNSPTNYKMKEKNNTIKGIPVYQGKEKMGNVYTGGTMWIVITIISLLAFAGIIG